MSKINRFMGPVQTQYQQTYVDQFVPLPFELMQKAADRKQVKLDQVRDYTDTLLESMKASVRSIDNAAMTSQIAALENQIDESLEAVNGDYSKIESHVKSVGRNWKNYMSTGHGAQASANHIAMTEYEKKAKESNMDSADKDRGIAAQEFMYNNTGGVMNGGVPQGINPYNENTYELNSKVLDTIKALVPDSKAKASFGFNDGKTVMFDNKEMLKWLSEKDIKGAVHDTVFTDNAWQEKTIYKYKVAAALGEIDPNKTTLTEYRDLLFDEEYLGGDAFKAMAYTNQDEDLSSRETEKGKAKGKASGEKETLLESIMKVDKKRRIDLTTGDHPATEGVANWSNFGKTSTGVFLANTLGGLGLKGAAAEAITGKDEFTQAATMNMIINDPNKFVALLKKNNVTVDNAKLKEITNAAIETKKQIQRVENDQTQFTEEYIEKYHAANTEKGKRLRESLPAYKAFIKAKQESSNNLTGALINVNLSESTIQEAKRYNEMYGDLLTMPPHELVKPENIARINKLRDEGKTNDASAYFEEWFGPLLLTTKVNDLSKFEKQYAEIATLQNEEKYEDEVKGKVEHHNNVTVDAVFSNAIESRDANGVVNDVTSKETVMKMNTQLANEVDTFLGSTPLGEEKTILELEVEAMQAKDSALTKADATEAIEKHYKDAFNYSKSQGGQSQAQPIKVGNVRGKNNGLLFNYKGVGGDYTIENGSEGNINLIGVEELLTDDQKNNLEFNTELNTKLNTTLSKNVEVEDGLYVVVDRVETTQGDIKEFTNANPGYKIKGSMIGEDEEDVYIGAVTFKELTKKIQKAKSIKESTVTVKKGNETFTIPKEEYIKRLIKEASKKAI